MPIPNFVLAAAILLHFVLVPITRHADALALPQRRPPRRSGWWEPSDRAAHSRWPRRGVNGDGDLTVRYLDPTAVAGAVGLAVVGGGALWIGGSEDRARRARYAEWEAGDRAAREERARLAHVEPRDGDSPWAEAELASFDGSGDGGTGPLLFAADGLVFNVWKGRHFYGPGCEYHIFAGRDATRLLAKSKLEEETEEEMKTPLSMAEKATLHGWMYTFKTKYEVVGNLEGFDPKTTAF